ncbi:MAG: DUF433 domain-containing protein [Blastocatellia bacterium]
MKVHERMDLGEYIVSDPKICGGELTFKGTRILVKDVLYFVAKGLDWDSISNEYHGLIGREAIAEAVRLASAAFVEKNATQRDDKRRRAA